MSLDGLPEQLSSLAAKISRTISSALSSDQRVTTWIPPHVLRSTDPVYAALDAARIALYRAQRGDANIDFDATDRMLSEAMDLRHCEKEHAA